MVNAQTKPTGCNPWAFGNRVALPTAQFRLIEVNLRSNEPKR